METRGAHSFRIIPLSNDRKALIRKSRRHARRFMDSDVSMVNDRTRLKNEEKLDGSAVNSSAIY